MELSKRVAAVIYILQEELKPKQFSSLMTRVGKAKDFESLSKRDKRIIIDAEKSNA